MWDAGTLGPRLPDPPPPSPPQHATFGTGVVCAAVQQCTKGVVVMTI